MRGRRTERKSLPGWINLRTVSLFIIALALGLVTVRRSAYITQQQQELDALAREVRELSAERDGLIIKLEPLKSTQRIENLAKIDLGMDYPRANQYVTIRSNYVFAEETEEKLVETGVIKSLFSALFSPTPRVEDEQ